MSKEGVAVIAILTVLILVALILPSSDESGETGAKLTESAAMIVSENKNENLKNENFIESKTNNAVKGLEVAREDIEVKNPFTFSHEARGETPKVNDIEIEKTENKKNNEDEKKVKTKTKLPKSATNKSKNKVTTDTEKIAAKWELRGVIITKDEKIALISFGKNTNPFKIGDVFDGKKIIAIEEDYIIYSGINGEERLNLSTP